MRWVKGWIYVVLLMVVWSGDVLAQEGEKEEVQKEMQVGEEESMESQESELKDSKEVKESKLKGSSFWPPRPGMAIKSGGGLYRSVPCQCVDRSLWTTQLVGRLHLGWRATVEADLRFGSMLLGGRFPSEGWAVGGRVALLQPKDRWWEGFHIRAGYRQWRVMGMRAEGSPGGYAGINWEVDVFPHVYVEADATVGRTFQAMQHWYLVGTLGVSTRF